MHHHRPIRLHHDQPQRLGKKSLEAPCVADLTTSNDQAHGASTSGRAGPERSLGEGSQDTGFEPSHRRVALKATGFQRKEAQRDRVDGLKMLLAIPGVCADGLATR
jgi:hypothetical protein